MRPATLKARSAKSRLKQGPPPGGKRSARCDKRGAQRPPRRVVLNQISFSRDSAARVVTSVGASGRSVGPPQARPAPSGGSAVHAVTSVGAIYA